MDVRSITRDDLPACLEIYYAAEDELYARLNLPLLPRGSRSLMRLFEHITTTDPERCWLAEDGGRQVAFGMAVERADLRFLSFLFVRPGTQARGAGALLLGRCVGGDRNASADSYRATCIEALQPVSAALYASFGMVPRTPIYTFVGKMPPRLHPLPDGLSLRPFAELAAVGHERLANVVNELDRQVLGLARPADHRAWLGWGRQGFLVGAPESVPEEAVGYGYAEPSGRLGPLVVLDGALLLPLLGELTRRVEPVEDWQVLVPGAARETFVALLRAGMRLEGSPALFCCTREGIDHSRYLPGSFALP